MNDLPRSSWRSLELLCRQQAALSSTPDARDELARMELEYKRLADWLELQRTEEEQPDDRIEGSSRRAP